MALTITSACATVLISGDNGGLMEDYTARFQQVRQSGEPVVIDGASHFFLDLYGEEAADAIAKFLTQE